MRLTIITILSIFALSMFLSCQEETSSGFRQCGRMILSDALPVQFWLSECDTFNEHEAGGVHHVCWCQPWNSSDPIVTQFQDTPGQNINMAILDEDGAFLYEGPFQEIQSGVYQHSFLPFDEVFTEGQIRLVIATGTEATIVNATAFNVGWTNVDYFSGPAWTLGATDMSVSISSISGPSDLATSPSFAAVGAGSLLQGNVTYNVQSGSSARLYILANNGATLELLMQQTIVGTGTDVNLIISPHVLVQGGNTSIVVQFEWLSGGISTHTIKDIFIGSERNILAKSDCLEIAESHDETIFIEYSNQTNYAGLIYENDSPDTTFGIRVPCRFFHEVEPEEDEAMELTSSVIITSSQVKTQRLLEVKHAPYYFHKKLRRVLKHQTITIFDKQWKKEEKYEVIEGKKTWPLKAATCLLTEKSSVVRNVS